MIETLVLSEHDLPSWAMRFEAGDVPSRAPYGVDVLEAQGFALHSVRRGLSRAGTKMRDALEHRSGYPWERAIRGSSGRYDLTVALLEREGFAAARMRAASFRGFKRSPVVIWSCWLADDLARADATRRRELVNLVKGADLIAHLSASETKIFEAAGIPAERLFALTYGVSHRFYTPGEQIRDLDILAVGQDRGRDYRTLINAVADTALRLEIVCKPDNLVGITIPPNVIVHSPVSLIAYRSLLRRARVVAVPTIQMAYPSGSSVALEAASSGCAVVATRTQAMRELFTDGETARLVDVGHAAGWRAVLTELTDDRLQTERLGRAGRRHVETKHNADIMWAELAEHLRLRGIIDPLTA